MIKILKKNYINRDEIEEVIGVVEGYAIKEHGMNEDSGEAILKRAIQKMIDEALLVRADVIIDFDISINHLHNGYCEVYCSGNAIKLKVNKYLN